MPDKNKNKNNKKQKPVFKAKQLFPPQCPVRQWTRLRLRTNDSISFYLWDVTRQMTERIVQGAIPLVEFDLPQTGGFLNRWVQATHRTGTPFWFYASGLDDSREYMWGWIYTPDFTSVMCSPLPAAPNLTGSWDTNLGRMVLVQLGLFNYRIDADFAFDTQNPGRINFGTIWGNEVNGIWRQGNETGRFMWRLAPDLRSFTGTRGVFNSTTNRGTWNGRKL